LLSETFIKLYDAKFKIILNCSGNWQPPLVGNKLTC